MWKFSGKAQFPDSFGRIAQNKNSTKFPHQEIRWNYGILRSVDYFNFKLHRFWNLSIYNKHHYIFFQHQGGFRGFRIVIIITHPCNRLLLKKLAENSAKINAHDLFRQSKKIKFKQIVTIEMICSTLASLKKFQYFRRPVYNPVEYLWHSFYCEKSRPLSIFIKSLHHRCSLGFHIRLCFSKTLQTFYYFTLLGDSRNYMPPILIPSSAKRIPTHILVITILMEEKILFREFLFVISFVPAKNYLFKVVT